MATLPAGYFGSQGHIWNVDGSGPYVMDSQSRMSLQVGAPADLYTDRNGPARRIRVDVGQTGFFAGREFRSYFELNIAVGTDRSFRFTSPVDFILESLELSLDSGGLRLETFGGAVTPAGVWTALPVIGKNRMAERPQPYYTSVCTLESGGTFTGGTALDVLRLKTSAQSNQASSVGAQQDDARGLPAGVYYIRAAPLAGVNDPATGVLSVFWEERLP